MYLGAASGTTVSHVSDIVGPTGVVYAVEFSHRPGRELINMAKSRPNIIPIIEDARHPLKYRMLVGMVDCIFADVAQPDQVRRPVRWLLIPPASLIDRVPQQQHYVLCRPLARWRIVHASHVASVPHSLRRRASSR